MQDEFNMMCLFSQKIIPRAENIYIPSLSKKIPSSSAIRSRLTYPNVMRLFANPTLRVDKMRR